MSIISKRTPSFWTDGVTTKEYAHELIPVTKGIFFTRTGLGEAIFMHEGADDASGSIRPSNWSVKQLRAMADFMEANPDCTLF